MSDLNKELSNFSSDTETNRETSGVSSIEDEKKIHHVPHEETISLDDELSSEERRPEDIYKQAWSKRLLIIAYGVLFFTAFVETFAVDSTSGLDSYATSAFDAHSLISTAVVVHKITAIVSYPLVAKLSDFFGRAEGFGLAIMIYALAYVLYAACQNIETFIAGDIFHAVGVTGYRIFQSTFIGETTSLINRGVLTQLPDCVSAVPSLYVGTILQDAFIDHWTWRWGFGIWAILLTATCIPLSGIMHILDKRAKQTGEQKIIAIMEDKPEGSKFIKVKWFLFNQLDLPGGCLLVLGLSLFFIPLTLTGTKSTYKWHEAKLIVMLCFGVVIFASFLIWNSKRFSNKVGKKPFVQPQTFGHNTIIYGFVITALCGLINAQFATYFKTTLQVAGYYSVGEAARIDDTRKACFQIFSVLTGLCMKYTKNTKIYLIFGLPFLLFSHALLAFFLNRDGHVSSAALLYMAEVFIGLGRGLWQCALLVTIQAIAGVNGIPMSTAFFLASQSTGSLIGTCISGGMWNTIVVRKLNQYLPLEDAAKATKIYKSINKALKYKKGTPTRDAIARLYRETEQLIGYVSAAILGPLLVLMWFLKDIELTDHYDIYATDGEIESLPLQDPVETNGLPQVAQEKKGKWYKPSFKRF